MRFSRLSIACLTILFAAQSQAQSEETSWQVCESPEFLPLFHPLDTSPRLDPLTLPTDISANAFNVQKQDESVFEGDVELKRGSDWLGTETLRYNH
ncbi:MAG TPA: hypothetical protein VN248_07965, partial [Arenimonas sp.]|nr:hypothetical protein [Arenimonas sp.]